MATRVLALHQAPFPTVKCDRSLPSGRSEGTRSRGAASLLGAQLRGPGGEPLAPALTRGYVLPVDLPSFVTHFEWDMAKYPAKQPLPSVVDILAKVRARGLPPGHSCVCDWGEQVLHAASGPRLGSSSPPASCQP